MKKGKHIIFTLLLGTLFGVPNCVFSSTAPDSLVMEKVFSFRKKHATALSRDTTNTYIRYNFRVLKRNPTLLFIPTMYYIAKGRRNYVGEIYGKTTFTDVDKFELKQQVYTSTIPHRRKSMSTMAQYLTPDLYGTAIFRDNILSPFHYDNRTFYRYRISITDGREACVTFRPRVNNTQLITGYAIVDRETGRIMRSRFYGEQDMVEFNVYVDMGENRTDGQIVPVKCEANALFSFAGNKIRSGFKAYYNCPTTLPDSLSDISDIQLMQTLRPDTLSTLEKEAYSLYFSDKEKRDTTTTTTTKRENKLKKIAWNILGDHLLTSLSATNSKGHFSLSPLINPLYLSYSHSRGLAYKIKIGSRYNFSENTNISLSSDLGYNFKIKQFYFTAPLRFTYDRRKDAYFEVKWANGNRITNSGILDMLKNERRDTIDFDALNLDYFKDEMWKLTWNTPLSKWLNVKLGTVYHRRRAVDKAVLAALGKKTVYRSFAPYVTLSFSPSPNWPVFTGNYERSVKRILRSNTEYERWEFDASYKKKLKSLRQYNLRLGGGFYTNRSTNYFVDFENFHENYIPDGWDDDWSGDFQLLNSQWYNASSYYVRGNVSYESPLLFLTWLPLVGRYIETERLYFNALQIEHTRPYFELGYSLTNRYFSVGVFGSLLNGAFHDFGCKFTFELFRKW